MKCSVLILVLCLGCGVLAYADTFALGGASTAGFYQGTLNGEAARGWDFRVNASDIDITSLAINSYASGRTTVTLWDIATRSQLAQVAINAVGGSWTPVKLSTPVPLVNGNQYAVIGWADNPDDCWYSFQFGPPAGFHPTGTIQYLDTRYGNSIDADTFPMATLTSYMYGVPDIGYVPHIDVDSPVIVPEPSCLALVGAGLAGLWGRHRGK